MTTPHPQDQPTPDRVLKSLIAYQETAALKSAISLGLFTAVGEGNTDAASIAKRVNAAERGVRILCDYLTVQGFLTKTDGQYHLAPDSAAFLDQRSPAYLGSIATFLAGDHQQASNALMGDSVRRGGTALPESPMEPNDPVWVTFAQAMRPLMHMPAETIASILGKEGPVHHVLDIAAGHGAFGIAVARQNPQAEVFAVDWPNVLNVAQQNAEQAGIAERFHTLPGSAFEIDLGSGYDVALVTNFLHHFDHATCVNFLRKVHNALAPGGRAAIFEFVPNPDRVSPPFAAGFSLMMLTNTPAGDAYTFDELSSMVREAGFADVQPGIPMGAQTLVIARKEGV